mmetsp:Transcript_12539/g.35600  ORF Transcript_12539/g.35600 Transcript_12539/m.35600 type:complete len:249 (+) Transcript_12539:864-1610(+)
MGTLWTFVRDCLEATEAAREDVGSAPATEDAAPLPAAADDPGPLLSSLLLFSSSIFFFMSILRRIRATPTYFFLGSEESVDAMGADADSSHSSLGAASTLSGCCSTGSSFLGSEVSLVLSSGLDSASASAALAPPDSGSIVAVAVAGAGAAAADFLPYRRCRAARMRAAFERLSFFSSSSWGADPSTYCIRLLAFSRIRWRRFSAWARAASAASSLYCCWCCSSSVLLSSSTVFGMTGVVPSFSSAIV